MTTDYASIAGRIDHALLLPNLTDAEVEQGCRIAAAYEVATVCVRPADVSRVAGLFAGTPVGVGTVIGFPHGTTTTATKVAESREAMAHGARELDMVVNIGQACSGRWDKVESDIAAVLAEARLGSAVLKVIFETCYLDAPAKIRLCEICSRLGVDYVKTSTGFGHAGATAPDLTLMRAHTAPHVKLKAAGGMKDLDAALDFVAIGSDRLGTSKTVSILDELRRRLGLKPIDATRVSRETILPKDGVGTDY